MYCRYQTANFDDVSVEWLNCSKGSHLMVCETSECELSRTWLWLSEFSVYDPSRAEYLYLITINVDVLNLSWSRHVTNTTTSDALKSGVQALT